MSTIAQSTASEQQALPPGHQGFFDAQRRNRRASWRLSVLCVLAAGVMGIPLAVIITPLIYGVVLIAADIVNLFSPLPDAFWQRAGEIAHYGLVVLASLGHKPADPQALALGTAVMLLPGTILSLVLWIGMSALLRRGGVGGGLLVLNAREPNQADVKELQLVDVVQEVSLAAGLPAPRVMLVDAPGANVATIGSSPKDARIIVSRCLVEDLSRDELEGALAHCIASIGNGDLRIAFQMIAVFETCGVLLAFVNSPFGPQSRHVLWRILHYGLAGSAQSQDREKEAAAVAAILLRSVASDADDISRFFKPTAKKSLLRSVRNFVFFPIFITNIAIKLSLQFFSVFVLGPSVAMLWRRRKYLADACAVQLTRNPDGLARALKKLDDDGGAIPGSSWASHLFLVNPGHSAPEALSPRQKAILAQAWAASAQPMPPAGKQASPIDLNRILKETGAMYRSAFAGDAQAMTRVHELSQAISTLDPALAAKFPRPR